MFWDNNEENLITIFTTDKYEDEIIVNVYSKLSGRNKEKRVHYKDFINLSNYDKTKEYIYENSMRIKGIDISIRLYTNC
jgi:hypothetical protein